MTDTLEPEMKCPKCAREMKLVDKQIFTAEDIREYYCGHAANP
jgi:hypothetical protein